MLVAKPKWLPNGCHRLFENYVNYAGSKTSTCITNKIIGFENYVNYAGSKTQFPPATHHALFENYVNYAGSKT